MKKILLLSAVLLGAVTASQAGVHFGFDIPLPAPPVVVAPPPVYVQPPAPAYVDPPPYYGYGYAPAPPVVVAPPPVLDFDFGYRRPYYRPRYYDYPRPGWRHGWEEHEEHEHHWR